MANSFRKILVWIAGILACFTAYSQAQIQTKSFKVADFREKTMKVVTTSDPMLDAALKDAIQKIWHISSYEFCTLSQFEKVKKSRDFYFLMVTDVKYKGESEAGTKSLTLYKGDENAKENVKGLLEILSMPVCKVNHFTGTEAAFMPALVNIFQNRLEQLLSMKLLASTSVRADSDFNRKWTQEVYIPESALAFTASQQMKESYREKGINICTDARAEQLVKSREEDVLVGFAIIPEEGVNGQVYHLYLVSAIDWKLCRIYKRSIEDGKPAGFTEKDMNTFYSQRSQK